MVALIVILILLVAFLLIPVGVDFSLLAGEMKLKVKVGLIRIGILPKKPRKKPKKPKKKKDKKKKEKKGKKKKKGDEAPASEGSTPAKKPKIKKITVDEIIEIAKIGLKALGRFRRSISIDRLMLHLTVATGDPYDTVMQYGYINTAIANVLPLLHRAFKVKSEDIGTAMDFSMDKMNVETQVVTTVRIGQVLFLAICAGVSALIWFLKRKKRMKAAAKAAQPGKDAE